MTAVLSVNYLDRFLSTYELPVSLAILVSLETVLLKLHSADGRKIQIMAGRRSLDDSALGSDMLVFGFENGRDFCATPLGFAGESVQWISSLACTYIVMFSSSFPASNFRLCMAGRRDKSF